MWLLLSFISAITTSLSTIFIKIGIKDVNSNFATLFRTFIVILCSIIMCLITHSFETINTLTIENCMYLILSGIATGCSWLFYNKAIKEGNINKVAPIDKSSFILTSILFMIFFFNDTTKNGDPLTISMIFLSMGLMLIGTIFMIDKKKEEDIKSNKRLIYAILSMVFASLVSLFIKLGLRGIDSSLGTLFRTIVVLIFSFLICLFKKDFKGVKEINIKSWVFLTLSGIVTGIAWLSEYYALNMVGVNPVAVNSIGKLSILLTMLFSFIFLKEKFSKKSLLGLALLTSGIIIIIVFSL